MKCHACLNNRTWECEYHGQCERILVGRTHSADSSLDASSNRTNAGNDKVSEETDSSFEDSSNYKEGSEEAQEDLIYTPGKPSRYVETYKDDSAIRDQQSTGRKRAAEMYPLFEGEPCEWRGQKNCGGGEFPIVGCIDGVHQARHHGPDKNTLNNEEGNVHRICHTCHNRWHARNDPGYSWGQVYEPHRPEVASPVDVLQDMEFWVKRGEPKRNVKD